MANKRLSDGVGKKIVEALKKQSEIEITPVAKSESREEGLLETFDMTEATPEEVFQEEDFLENLAETSSDVGFGETTFQQPEQPFVSYQQPTPAVNDNFIKELDNFEIPSNIAVLKKLISQLPSGVTRHTGAQIIKQTMEALGISMKSVLQEAQQVQDGLSNSAKECHATIQEYKKQILLLEKQAQNHQRQYAALNELISLFIQTGV
ncbi:MAG: hypothetical protein PHC64_03830 [Candidatus Gastranaerophilales bacterium]|nr:hypothetical protein [Candidatus Gastranaerophilales bacterium]